MNKKQQDWRTELADNRAKLLAAIEAAEIANRAYKLALERVRLTLPEYHEYQDRRAHVADLYAKYKLANAS